MLAIRLPTDIESRLTALAQKTGRTKTYYAREAIIEHLADLEAEYLAVARMKKTGRIWISKEVKRHLGMAD